jgi:hypothetical protein
MLKIQIFLDVKLCRWVNSSRHSKDHSSFISNFTHWYSRMPNSSGLILCCGGCVMNFSHCTSDSVILYICMYSSVTDKTTQSSAKDLSTVRTQVYKNPHCALCNGVPPLNTECWEPLDITGEVPSLTYTFILVASKDENQQHRWQYVTQTNSAAQNHRQVWWFTKFLK